MIMSMPAIDPRVGLSGFKDMGLIYIAEQVSPEDNPVTNLKVNNGEDTGVKYAEFDTCLQSFRCLNRNSRKYWGPNLAEMLLVERIQSLLSHNAWYGEMDWSNGPCKIYLTAGNLVKALTTKP